MELTETRPRGAGRRRRRGNPLGDPIGRVGAKIGPRTAAAASERLFAVAAAAGGVEPAPTRSWRPPVTARRSSSGSRPRPAEGGSRLSPPNLHERRPRPLELLGRARPFSLRAALNEVVSRGVSSMEALSANRVDHHVTTPLATGRFLSETQTHLQSFGNGITESSRHQSNESFRASSS